MPKVIYVTPDGVRHETEVETGYSIMEGAINNNIEGIVAECGGACACATCHSYVDDAWLERIPPMDDMEDSMLDAAFERKGKTTGLSVHERKIEQLQAKLANKNEVIAELMEENVKAKKECGEL